MNILQLLVHALIDPQARDALIEALQKQKQQSADDSILRDIVADHRKGDMHTFAPVEGGRVAPADAGPPVVSGPAEWQGRSRTEEFAFERMLSQQDALDRADRLAQLAKLKGSGR